MTLDEIKKGNKQRIKVNKHGIRFLNAHGRIFHLSDFESCSLTKKNFRLVTFDSDQRVRVDQINKEIIY